ncbi:hypothetical protein Tery_4433 [Trichodesmium erythraeum IMS101]|uniref:Glycoside hydrolase family 42 N-terminal domain-containing protein n=1 Tax=Trichodesmium erythraeum (strain IMS101) TaxID=203124 RepID=Q10WF4_TRIEI|nr:beta-galactosidase [Trichodesmium erythraeum GBRTRLIN201]
MKKILYIHIGTGKTGTSSIQNFLSENQKNGRLSKHFNTRYCFSGRPNIHNILLCKNYQRGNEKTQELIDAKIRELRKEIYQSSEQLFIISSEYFPGNTQDEIHELVNTVSDICQVKIIVYLRRQDDFLWSWYTQLVKTTNIFLDIYKLKDKLYKGPQQVFNYETSLRKWENIVGKENILVNIYDRNNFKENSIYFDFIHNLNIDLDLKKMIVPEEVNLSLQCEQICLIRTLIPYVSEWNDEQLKMLQKPLNIPFLYTKSLLSPRERKEILNDFRQHNEFVARRYLNQENLFDENIEDEDTWREPNIFSSGYFEKYIDYIKTEKKTLFELLQPILKNVNRMKIKTVRNMLLVNNIFIVDWTEKAGCTIVCKMFFDVMGILQEALDYNSWIHNYRQDKFYEKFGKVTEDMLSGDKFVKMKFVRNPYTRAVSSYFAANENNKQYLKGYEHLDLSFYDFLLLVKQKKIVNDHWRTQYQEIESRFNFDEIIKIENIEQEVKRLNQKYSLNLQLHTHSSHHHKKDKNKSEFVGRKKYSELEISGTIPDYRNFYDDETKLLVSEIYEKDLKTYKYTFDLEKNQERIKAENTDKDKKMKHNINYITIWENEWNSVYADEFLIKAANSDINTVAFDMRWHKHETNEGNFDFSHTQDRCDKLIEHGFKLMPLISIFYCPNWVHEKYPDIVELNETFGAIGSGHKGVSSAYEKSLPLALNFIDKCIDALECYRQDITAISVSWNNEHETKFTQTHDLFRPYEKSAQEKFRLFIEKKNSSIKYWNDRWNTSFDCFAEVTLPTLRCENKKQIEQFQLQGQFIFDFYAFRRFLLVNIYQGCCERIKSHQYKTWLHFGEIFTCIDAIYQGDVVFDMITENWLDIVVIDSNLSKIGVETNDPFVSYVIVSACQQYDKPVIFEVAVERDKSIEVYKESILWAQKKNVDGLGHTNFMNRKKFHCLFQNSSLAAGMDGVESTKHLLLIHPIRGCGVLRQRQHIVGAISVDPVQDYLMGEVKHWYDRGFNVDIIGDPLLLNKINQDVYNEIVYLEPLALLSVDKKHISDFVERLPSDKPYYHKKLDRAFFEHQTGFDGEPLEFLSFEE